MRKLLTKAEIETVEPFIDSMTEDEVAQYAYSKGFYDDEFFANYFLDGHSFIYTNDKLPIPRHIKEIWKIINKKQDFNLIIARGHNKTTGILIKILKMCCYKLEREILYISTENLGEAAIGKIRGELETNEIIIRVFGNLVPKNSDDKKDKNLKKRRQKMLELTNGTTLMTMSKGQSVRGQRPSCIFIDDPQENKDVQSKQMVDKFNEWVFTSLYNTLLPGGYMVVVGTIIGNLCLVEYLRTEKKRNTIKKEACDENFNNLLRPELRTKEALMQRKEKLGTPYFNQEFRNIPLSKEDVLIKPDQIKHYEPSELPEQRDMIVGSIDPIRKASEKSDYMGISIRGVSGRKKYCIFSKAIRLSRLKAGTFICMVNTKYQPDTILYEINVEATLYDWLLERGLPMEEVNATKDKYAYLLDIQPQFERGEVYLRKDKDEVLERQLTNFPDVDHDDVMDTCTKALRWIEQHMGGIATSI